MPHPWKSTNTTPEDATAAFNRALRYLNLRARSKKEIEDYLSKKGFSIEAIHQSINRLSELHFLDDERYGESFARTRQEYKGKSKYFIKYELQQKGLDQETIEKVLEGSQDDLQTAQTFVERKKRIYSNLDKKEFQEKMMRLLSSRGFSFDMIRKALKD